MLGDLGLGSHFEAVVGGDEAPCKPDPAGTLGILARLGGSPADAVLIGDGCANIALARSIGIPLVSVTWGLTPRPALIAAGAPLLVDRVEDLNPFLA